MKNKKLSLPFRTLLTLSVLLLALFFLLVNSIQFSALLARYDRTEREALQQNRFDQLHHSAAERLRIIQDIIDRLSNHTLVATIVHKYEATDNEIQKVSMREQLRNLAKSIQRLESKTLGFYLLLPTTSINCSSVSIFPSAYGWLQETYADAQNRPLLIPPQEANNIWKLSGYPFLSIPLACDHGTAYLIIPFTSDFLCFEDAALLTDELVYSNQTTLSEEELRQSDRIVWRKAIDGTPYTLAWQVEDLGEAASVEQTRLKLLLIAFIGVFILALSPLFSRKITAPITEYTRRLAKLQLSGSAPPDDPPALHIRRRVFSLLLSVILVIVTLVGGGSYWLMSNLLTHAAEDSLNHLATDTHKELNAYLDQIVQYCIYLGYDTGISKVLSGQSTFSAQPESAWYKDVVYENEIKDAVQHVWELMACEADFGTLKAQANYTDGYGELVLIQLQ